MSYQILLALNHIHACNITHRDLKPENIQVDEDWNIKILDFGLGNYYNMKALTEVVGTPYYVAPEVLTGEYSKECDMWSFGVILYLLITGRTPFNGSNPQELLENVLEATYRMEDDDWKEFSQNAKDIVSRLLIKDPSKRLTAQEALKHPWFDNRFDYGKLDA